MILVGLGLSVLVGVSLGFFGGGGSILTVPLLLYVFGLDPKEAIGSSLLIVAAASAVGALRHWQAGNVQLGTAAIFGATGIVGAYAGGRVSESMNGGILLLLFACVMILTSIAMWRGRRGRVEVIEPAPRGAYMLALQGLLVGAFTGLVGAGGGFLIVPALALWAGLAMPAAVATSLVIIVANSLAGFSGYVAHVSIDYGLVALISVCAVGGSLIGTRLTRLISPASLRRSFGALVFLMGAGILLREAKLVVDTAGPALPETLPQLVFVALVLLGGVMAGRASRGPLGPSPEPVDFASGEGI
ncbi:MAG TPA: sulfite exporter TauE/SafE family protein [Myxococcales bacterium]|nr:sulfite exporter TauE/SafE family protein [Myxococcales bacterium]